MVDIMISANKCIYIVGAYTLLSYFQGNIKYCGKCCYDEISESSAEVSYGQT